MVINRLTAKATTEQFKFAGHETFHLRDGWLYKGLKALQADGSSLHQQDAHHKLGIGINMLKSLIYWLQATKLVNVNQVKGISKPLLELTPLAELILQKDTYFEDIRTLWLLHIQLCSNRRLATFWYWVFNECPQREFTEERLIQGVQHFIDESGIKQVAKSSLVKDAHCLIRTYLSSDDYNQIAPNFDTIECPLASLGLMRRSAIPGYYKFQVGPHRNLSTELFVYSLYRFRDLVRPEEVALSLEDIRWAPLSPGRLFNLDTHSILQYLEEIDHLTSHIHIIRTAELNMVALDKSTRSNDLLMDCYSDGD